jgi:hypothetical protein
MVVAMIALFAALTGTAVATTSALITGNQIKNSSITGLDVKNKSLTPRDFRGSVRGPRGPRGLTGAPGAPGAAGAKGDKGDKGDAGRSALSPLQAGETVYGVIYDEGEGGAGPFGTHQSLPIPAPVALDNAHVHVDVADDAGNLCTGSYSNPTAPQGYVCVYLNSSVNASAHDGFVPAGQPTKFGFNMSWTSAAGHYWTEGSWAYTAPTGGTVAVPSIATAGSGSAG